MFSVLAALCTTAAAVQAQPAAQAAAAQAAAGAQAAEAAAAGYHVLVVQDSPTTKAEDLMSLLTDKLGAEREKALPLLDKLNKKGSAVVVAGSKDACDKAAVQFEEIGLKTEVRPLEAADVPSEYDDSDVVVGGAKELNDALKEGNPVLVVFHAPWCGHCKTMVPAVKEAATTLKAEVPDTTVMAIDGQVSPAVVRQLGVQAYPSVLWLQLGDQLMLAEHAGARDAASLVEFVKGVPAKIEEAKAAKEAEAGGAAAAEGAGAAAASGEAAAAAAGSKLGESKVGQSKVGASKLAQSKGAESPASAAAAEAGSTGETAAADGEAAAAATESKIGVKKAQSPAQAAEAAAQDAEEMAQIAQEAKEAGEPAEDWRQEELKEEKAAAAAAEATAAAATGATSS